MVKNRKKKSIEFRFVYSAREFFVGSRSQENLITINLYMPVRLFPNNDEDLSRYITFIIEHEVLHAAIAEAIPEWINLDTEDEVIGEIMSIPRPIPAAVNLRNYLDILLKRLSETEDPQEKLTILMELSAAKKGIDVELRE